MEEVIGILNEVFQEVEKGTPLGLRGQSDLDWKAKSGHNENTRSPAVSTGMISRSVSAPIQQYVNTL